jgi:hypothetical protein
MVTGTRINSASIVLTLVQTTNRQRQSSSSPTRYRKAKVAGQRSRHFFLYYNPGDSQKMATTFFF